MHNTSSNSFNELYFYSQNDLFSHIESKATVLTDKLYEVITVIELSEIDKFVMSTARGSVGRPNKYRVQIARAFIGKAVLDLGTTNELIERLTLGPSLKRICGFPLNKRIPDKTVFSRAFAEFS